MGRKQRRRAEREALLAREQRAREARECKVREQKAREQEAREACERKAREQKAREREERQREERERDGRAWAEAVNEATVTQLLNDLVGGSLDLRIAALAKLTFLYEGGYLAPVPKAYVRPYVELLRDEGPGAALAKVDAEARRAREDYPRETSRPARTAGMRRG